MTLTHRRALPLGGIEEARPMRDGWPLHSILWPAGTAGSILVLGGRGDFVEKYSEALWHWRDRGFGLAAFDWRGFGHSGRLGDSRLKGHSTGFDVLVADLAEQIAWFRERLPPPHYVVAHSLGGHLLLRHLATAPDSVDRAVLLSPMLGLRAAPIGPWLARRLAAIAVAVGAGGAFVPGGRLPVATRGAWLTTDIGRRVDEGWWTEHHPDVAIGGVTWGWLAAAFASFAGQTKAALAATTTPLLILTAGDERLVDNRATARLAKTLPHARLETIPGGRHELLREADAIRQPVLAAIDAFLA